MYTHTNRHIYRTGTFLKENVILRVNQGSGVGVYKAARGGRD